MSSDQDHEHQSRTTEYEVEKIVGKRTQHGKIQYKVQWAGFPSAQNTWEPEINLSRAKHMIKKFEAKQERKKMRKMKRKMRVSGDGQDAEETTLLPETRYFVRASYDLSGIRSFMCFDFEAQEDVTKRRSELFSEDPLSLIQFYERNSQLVEG